MCEITVVNIDGREVEVVDRAISCIEAFQRGFYKVNSKVGEFEKLSTEGTKSVTVARGRGQNLLAIQQLDRFWGVKKKRVVYHSSVLRCHSQGLKQQKLGSVV